MNYLGACQRGFFLTEPSRRPDSDYKSYGMVVTLADHASNRSPPVRRSGNCIGLHANVLKTLSKLLVERLRLRNDGNNSVGVTSLDKGGKTLAGRTRSIAETLFDKENRQGRIRRRQTWMEGGSARNRKLQSRSSPPNRVLIICCSETTAFSFAMLSFFCQFLVSVSCNLLWKVTSRNGPPCFVQ
jgi:hypothetical protein